MSIRFEWIKHPSYDDGRMGLARYKIGERYHDVHIADIDTAAQVHRMLVHAHEAGQAQENSLTIAREHQRVKDLLSG